MKKLVLMLSILLLFTGCNKSEKQTISYDNDYYQVATPYKETTNNYSLNSFNKEEVESMLMYLSTNYFSLNNSLYQEGQYLSTNTVKDLVNKYNDTDKLLNDNMTKPTYISAIYEQDYLANNSNLKGISLAIILNTNQSYIQDNKTYNQVLDESEVLDFGKIQASKLLSYLRSIEELKNIKIVIGLYVNSNNYLKGSFKYIGSTSNNKIDLDYVNYNYRLLDSSSNMQNDINNYNNAIALKNVLNNYNVYIKMQGLYKDNDLLKLDIAINSNYLKQAEILNMANIITDNLNSFSTVVTIKVYFISNSVTKALLIKENDEAKIYMMEE